MFAPVYAVTLILAAFARFAFAHTCARQYTVKNGDSCDKISRDQQVSTYQLNASNPGLINSGCTNLMVGQTICLALANHHCSTTYVALPGDTCDKICAANGISLTTLRQNNPQLGPACDIYIGQVLCVSKKVQVLSTMPPEKPTTSSPPNTTPCLPSTASFPPPPPPPTTASSPPPPPTSFSPTTTSSPPPLPLTSFCPSSSSSIPTTSSSPTSFPPTTASSSPTTASSTAFSPPTTTSSPPQGTTITFPSVGPTA